MAADVRHRPEHAARIVVLLLLLAAVLVGPATPAEAGPPVRNAENSLSVHCQVGETAVMVYAYHSDETPGILDVVVESPDGVAFGFTDTASVTDTTASGVVDLEGDEGGEWSVIGTATIDVVLAPSGPTESSSDRFRDGNVQVRFEDESTPATVTGSIVLDGVGPTSIDPAVDCTGELQSFTSFATNPATYVDRFDRRYLDCAVFGDDASGFVFAFDEEWGAGVDLFLETMDGTVRGFADDPVFTDEQLTATLELVEEETGEPVGTAVLDATLTVADTHEEDVHTPRETIRVTVTEFAVDGALAIADSTYELVECSAMAESGFVRFTSPSGGRPAPNDAPADAIALAVPDSSTVSTTRTDIEPEAPCTIVDDEFGDPVEYELPITHTVWYRIEGIDGPVTVDTAGSGFDTIVGVYTTDLEQVACVDDVDSLQARVTVDTVAGETYLVQIGGFGDSTGRLEVTTDG